MRKIIRAILIIIGIGLLYALLRAFNWDVFVLVDWAWSWIVSIVTSIADFFSGNDTFQKVTKAPSTIALYINP